MCGPRRCFRNRIFGSQLHAEAGEDVFEVLRRPAKDQGRGSQFRSGDIAVRIHPHGGDGFQFVKVQFAGAVEDAEHVRRAVRSGGLVVVRDVEVRSFLRRGGPQDHDPARRVQRTDHHRRGGRPDPDLQPLRAAQLKGERVPVAGGPILRAAVEVVIDALRRAIQTASECDDSLGPRQLFQRPRPQQKIPGGEVAAGRQPVHRTVADAPDAGFLRQIAFFDQRHGTGEIQLDGMSFAVEQRDALGDFHRGRPRFDRIRRRRVDAGLDGPVAVGGIIVGEISPFRRGYSNAIKSTRLSI